MSYFARDTGASREDASSLENQNGKRRNGSVLDLLFMLALCALLVFGVVRPFVAEVFKIPSGSMIPTLEPGDRVLAVKFAYRVGEPHRGELAAFEAPDGEINIKRAAAVGGDTIAILDGVLHVNGEKKMEPYVNYELTDSTFYGPKKVPEGEVFMLGDNRSNSVDSRDYEAIPEEDLLGRVILRVWPLSRAGSL